MPRIHIGDIATVDDGSNPKDTFMHVVGRLNIGKYEDFEGMWELQEFKGDETRYKTLGRYITVWKPLGPPTIIDKKKFRYVFMDTEKCKEPRKI